MDLNSWLNENRLFRQSLRPAQILILKIRQVFLRLKIFAVLDLDEKSWFSFGH